LHAATAIGQKRVDEIEWQLHNAVVDSPLTPLIGAVDMMAASKALPLSHQPFVIDSLVTVRLLASGHRGPTSTRQGQDPVQGRAVR
jgi:site-specific DNA recombinase